MSEPKFSDAEMAAIEKEGLRICRQVIRADKAREERNRKDREARATAALLRAKYPEAKEATPADVTLEWVAYRVKQDVSEWDDGPYHEWEIAQAIFRAIATDDTSPWQAVAKAALEGP
jgi:hypothetical protein